ncbi:hypothetical protein Tsubulata_037879 [Turnera subulata]|uniref:Chromo domain-containing protein n=1 Tax=Turnera subulata TaxID=218843 RepID=A0A9Q0FUX7_9ROSI|nr:hypothetical protein Tsubulata_037879 [Turnera subulata]
MILTPVAILDKRTIKECDSPVEQWLVRWDGLPESAATWENKRDLLKRFASLNLEDKVQRGDGGIVVSSPAPQQEVGQGIVNEVWMDPTSPAVPTRRSERTKISSRRLDGYALG